MKKLLIDSFKKWKDLEIDTKAQVIVAVGIILTFIGTTYFQYNSNKLTKETTFLDRRPYLSIRFINPMYKEYTQDTFIGGDILYANYGKVPANDIQSSFFITTDMDKTNHTLEGYAYENWGGNKIISFLAPNEGDAISRKLSLSPATKFYYINAVVSYKGLAPKKTYWILLIKTFRIIDADGKKIMIEIDSRTDWDKDRFFDVPTVKAPDFNKYTRDVMVEINKINNSKGGKMSTFTIIYTMIALLISVFYGSFAVRIWLTDPEKYKFTQRVYQFIFNLLGGLYGFALLYYLFYKTNSAFQTSDFKIMNFGDLILLVIAIMGTMGQLPGAISNLAQNIHSAISRK